MILVLLGTQHNEFRRIIEEVEKCIEKEIINEEVIVQAGFTKYKSDKMKIFDVVSQTEIIDLIKNSNIIITHGGAGSIILALKHDKKVIAVPRLSKFGEHVNDHQKDIVKAFNQKGFLIGINEVEELPTAIQKIKSFKPNKYENDSNKILNIIENFIDNV